MTAVAEVRLASGPAAGTVLEVPRDRVEKVLDDLNLFHLKVTAANKLYDMRRARYVTGVVVKELPPAPAAVAQPTTSIPLREETIPEHKPSRPRPPRATVPVKKAKRIRRPDGTFAPGKPA